MSNVLAVYSFFQCRGRWYRLLLVAINLLFLSGVAAQDSEEDRLARIDGMLATITEAGDFSGTVLIARDGEILFQKGYGYAVVEWEVPNTPDSVFHIASITKEFTAMAILMLQEQGLLNVQDRVCNYIDDCPLAWQEITIHHLLNHSSGLQNTLDMMDFANQPPAALRPENLVNAFKESDLLFAPGESWGYSNQGYMLLGYIIEQVSGSSYRTFLRENIFEPLGMEHSDYAVSGRLVPYMTLGYDAGLRSRALPDNINVAYAAGGLRTTVGDLLLWDQALFGAKLIPQASWDAMLATAVPADDGSMYAYGFYLGTGEHPFIGHGGGFSGYSSSHQHFPEHKTTIIILENTEGAPWDISLIIAGILFDE